MRYNRGSIILTENHNGYGEEKSYTAYYTYYDSYNMISYTSW